MQVVQETEDGRSRQGKVEEFESERKGVFGKAHEEANLATQDKGKT
jgi:hypothetical protein